MCYFLVNWIYIVAVHIDVDKLAVDVSILWTSHPAQKLQCRECSVLHLHCGMFALYKHVEHTYCMCSAVFPQLPAVYTKPLGVLGLILVDGKLVVMQLLNFSDVSLVVKSA